MTKKLKAP
jgi:hypothetical protein